MLTRRGVGGLAAAAIILARPALAQAAPLRIGLMLPYSGTFAQLGENITTAFELHLAERGGRLGGRAVTVIKLDDGSDPAAAPQNVNRLLNRDKADVLVGTVHSGVVMALVQAARDKGVPLVIPNAGNVAASRELCSESVFRTSSATGSRPTAWARRWPATGVKRAARVTWGPRAAGVPAPGSVHRPPRRPALGRRAADGRHRPRPDDQPAAADP